ncbi:MULTISPECIES: flavodoxin-dependent (E)-4-hydroxy-3-methylbut-2-enyl-diphosphate synthase [Colwellia]|uniref:4-hydroxy-3-methylbut-2-en-1-yl diphosphate synthase (flavodoxin) n=1 Tax=Colwellia psychrerythraea (strain 34H / ATCC BAA-681) TaxID=167879 RepID=ISPG_COLP3|nr:MULTISPECIES: flavodoxin-dependent (E)-4-hydroxy-3-methylbut-2-enyl-diphosphate synthase [Colwellia]Q47WC0.1 RecName: Full=4-hydroxy-3-methylbut-2-en-1-yl diphosphate synthase (flavodoxin); AltName: Full=1-hydroxy-2-methyl-2-(E)-butenyl 4-diphosphate synthase [Colwellia psychrerythraea 34H]AAZ24704.1 1-hydroxy-2-methyl-2-(E)-butenyl 4-diphosphate synthase [Colwellia psychrerythraea 34H]PKH85379.1 4-hydroxy-3-methylbut-2-en-1-yl diphosphate synthase (flavodoxin) [Colwellia sp. Bg11-28]
MFKESPIIRRVSRQIMVGNVPVGGDAPITVQSMTNTLTTDVAATVAQIKALEAVGADIVRVSVPTMDAAEAFREIKKQVNVPLVADIHFDYRIALKVAEYGVDCLRINPGNIGNENRIRSVVECARDNNIPIRIGVNGGSLEKDIQEKYTEPTPEALLESAMRHVDILDRLNFNEFKVSVKASDVFLAVESYKLLAKQIDNPLHLGITEAGGLRSGSVKSSVGLGLLLAQGIGDTIRISLAADPIEEIKVGFDILKSLKLRSRGINLIACPSCSRQEFDVVSTVNALEQRIEDIMTPMDVSIIGCIVNGPGEAMVSDLGLTGSSKKSGYYLDGIRQKERFDNTDLVDQLEQRIRAKARSMSERLDEKNKIDILTKD